MLELNNAFKRIDDVMMSVQEWSSDSKVSAEERNDLILNLSRSLWNLHIARHHEKKLVEENISLTLALAPRGTEMITSHGHAITKKDDEIKGTMVPSTEVEMAKGQFEQSVEGTINNGNESVIYNKEVKDSIEIKMLMSINAKQCLWVS